MKRFLIFFLVAILAISLTACGGDKNIADDSSDNVVTTQGEVDPQPTVNQIIENEYNPVLVTMASDNKENVAQYFNIMFPTDEGREIRYGRGSAALDGTWVICGTSIINDIIECNSVAEIYESYGARWEETVEKMRHDNSYSDCRFTVENREMTEISGFSMIRYEGTHTYNYTDFNTGAVNPFSCSFVAYGTQLSNGGFVYWIVFDDSADQSLKDRVILNAENMAKSLEETTIF